jgi:hypothetical protein
MSYNMLSFIPHSRTAWSGYFPGTNPTTTLVPKEYTSTQTLSDTYVYVSNCLFNKCSSSSNGGAFYCSSSVTYLLVESSSFFSCKTSSSQGGAIYFYNSDGECVLHKICGNDCYSTYTGSSSNGQFGYIYVKNTASSKNYVNYSSIVRCVNENSNSRYSLRLYYGKNLCQSVNMSMNKCGYYPGFSCESSYNSSSTTCSLSYSSFSDNIVTGHICLYSNGGTVNITIKSCNILRNTQGNLNTDGIIRFHAHMMVEDSCILENIAPYFFNPGSSSYRITLSKFTIDKATTSTGTLIMQNTVTKSFILALNHVSTRNCNSEYDSVGILTPITQPLSATKKPYYTCERFLYQPHLRDFVSLMWIFIFNIIHPNPSI